MWSRVWTIVWRWIDVTDVPLALLVDTSHLIPALHHPLPPFCIIRTLCVPTNCESHVPGLNCRSVPVPTSCPHVCHILVHVSSYNHIRLLLPSISILSWFECSIFSFYPTPVPALRGSLFLRILPAPSPSLPLIPVPDSVHLTCSRSCAGSPRRGVSLLCIVGLLFSFVVPVVPVIL